MTEIEIDTAIAGLVKLKVEHGYRALGPAIRGLKEYRQKRAHWRNLSRAVRVLNKLQKQNLRETDALRKALYW